MASRTLDQLDVCFDDTHAVDDADLLRCGATSQVLGHRVMAPSTLGTFLRSFTFGHVRQLGRLTEQFLTRTWAAGAGPGDGPMTADLELPGSVCEVHGYHKRGAADGYTHTLGYHPLAATRADTGECCTPASGPGGPTPPAAPQGSSTSWPPGCAAPAPAAS